MILITGGDGLIGGALARELAGRGAALAATSRRIEAPWHLDLGDVARAVLPSGVSTAVLAAWHGGVNECAADPAGTAAINVRGHLALVERLRAAGASIIFLSTSLVFSAPPTAPRSPLTPCCDYARQKAAVEAALDPARDAVVRVTKVAETLLPRLRGWVADFKEGRTVRAAPDFRVAPVRLAEVASGLASLTLNFRPGVFQMSAACDTSYLEVACLLGRRLGVSPDLLLSEPPAGRLFDPVPSQGSLDIAGPPECRDWPSGSDAMQSLVEQAIS